MDAKEVENILSRIDSKFIDGEKKALIQELANQILSEYGSREQLALQFQLFLVLIPYQLPPLPRQ